MFPSPSSSSDRERERLPEDRLSRDAIQSRAVDKKVSELKISMKARDMTCNLFGAIAANAGRSAPREIDHVFIERYIGPSADLSTLLAVHEGLCSLQQNWSESGPTVRPGQLGSRLRMQLTYYPRMEEHLSAHAKDSINYPQSFDNVIRPVLLWLEHKIVTHAQAPTTLLAHSEMTSTKRAHDMVKAIDIDKFVVVSFPLEEPQ